MAFDVSALDGDWNSAVLDGMAAGLADFLQADRRKALIAFTNGADFSSAVSVEALGRAADRLGPEFILVGAARQIGRDRHERNVERR